MTDVDADRPDLSGRAGGAALTTLSDTHGEHVARHGGRRRPRRRRRTGGRRERGPGQRGPPGRRAGRTGPATGQFIGERRIDESGATGVPPGSVVAYASVANPVVVDAVGETR